MADRGTVMVVDDDDALRATLCLILQEDGYRAVGYDDGDSALRHLRTGGPAPDVILLDLMMPRMNGWQFREAQLRDPLLASIPVVVLTASRDVPAISAAEVLHKPPEIDRLLAAIRRHTAEAPRPAAGSHGGTEDRFRMLADNMSQLAWTCDLLGNVTWYNKRWLDYTGLAFEDMKGWEWSKVQHPDHVDRVVARVRRSAETGEPWEDTFPLRGRDGTYRWFLSRAVPIRDEGGQVVQWFGTNTDVTEQKLAEEEVARQAEELLALNERLTELDRAKSRFFSNVSHELRTPLTLMLGPATDLLAGAHGSLSAAQADQIDLLQRNGLRLQKLVDGLLDFSRIEAGRIQASYQPIDLAGTTRDIASAFRSAIERAGLALVVDCPPLDEPVYVDRDMWERIVLNLLLNALKFTFEGRIEVSLRASGGSVTLRIEDTGVGIPEEEVPRLFERFHRVQGVRARTHEGSGIGLALVEELAKLHGGSVGTESTVDVGTRFTVTLPTGSAHLPQDRIGAPRSREPSALGAAPFVEEALRWLPTPNDGPASGRVHGSRVLLADDNADMRDYVRRLLEPHYDVETAADGLEALAAALARPPQLVLTDVMMPGIDGFELLRRLREDERTENVPVVMLSARAGEEARVDGLSAGAEDYLTKPFSARELLVRVRTHLELARLRAEARTLLANEQAERREAERALELGERFDAILGHDLRSPLGAILIDAGLLLRRGPDERTAGPLKRIRASAERMGRMVEQILDFTRVRIGGGIGVEPREMDLAVVMAEIVAEHRVAAPLPIELARAGDTRGAWDADRLAQVVSNLVGNAIVHGDRSLPVRVSIDGSAPDVVRVTVWNGGAIGPDLVAALFDPYRRAMAPSIGPKPHGLGLGLFIVREIVEAHGGAVDVRSSAEAGTTFLVGLPRWAVRRPGGD